MDSISLSAVHRSPLSGRGRGGTNIRVQLAHNDDDDMTHLPVDSLDSEQEHGRNAGIGFFSSHGVVLHLIIPPPLWTSHSQA